MAIGTVPFFTTEAIPNVLDGLQHIVRFLSHLLARKISLGPSDGNDPRLSLLLGCMNKIGGQPGEWPLPSASAFREYAYLQQVDGALHWASPASQHACRFAASCHWGVNPIFVEIN